MIMVPGTGTISNYASFTRNCTLRQMPYKVPVNSLADVQLYIDIGAVAPGAATYELIHTCGADGGTIETIIPGSYVVGKDTNDNYYGVFREFTGATPVCFVIAITLGSQIYFSDEYCVEPDCHELTLIRGCYGNLDPLLSYDCEGIYFGVSQGGTLGDASVVYKHQTLMRGVEVTISAIKMIFKQGRTRNFRTEAEDIFQFWCEPVPEWYIKEIKAVFLRGEVYVGDTKYLVNETQFEKIEECKKMWRPAATLKESCMKSFSCEIDPCGDPIPECCDPEGVEATVEFESGGFACCDPEVVDAVAEFESGA